MNFDYYRITEDSLSFVYDIDPNPIPGFEGKQWDVEKTDGYKASYSSAKPFAVTLTRLMEAVVRKIRKFFQLFTQSHI